MGGRATLISSVMTNFPLHYFAFFKVPKSVVQKIVAIQRNFLWSRSKEKKGITWVSWSNVYKSKEDGGLGIRDVGRFNTALMAKWIWRLLPEKDAIWVGILDGRYGRFAMDLLRGKLPKYKGFPSLWWRDIFKANGLFGPGKFGELISYKLGNGDGVLFWLTRLLGN
ncbi:unnamed protein product [Lathyrus sativus]|nr:unnamed protein product [Lathyrus sativus]